MASPKCRWQSSRSGPNNWKITCKNGRCLRGLILLMDVRHPLQPFDQQMLAWALEAAMPVHILLTKADKLKRGPATSTLLKVRARAAGYGQLVSVQLFSALKHSGHKELIDGA